MKYLFDSKSRRGFILFGQVWESRVPNLVKLILFWQLEHFHSESENENRAFVSFWDEVDVSSVLCDDLLWHEEAKADLGVFL